MPEGTDGEINMEKQDEIALEILDNGTIRVSTDQISPANHLSADQFLKLLSELAGGGITKTKNRKSHIPTHQHDHAHH